MSYLFFTGVASQRTAGEAKKKSGYKTGVVRELLSEDEVSQSMPVSPTGI